MAGLNEKFQTAREMAAYQKGVRDAHSFLLKMDAEVNREAISDNWPLYRPATVTGMLVRVGREMIDRAKEVAASGRVPND